MGADFGALGLSVGHATDTDGATGLTVIRGTDAPFRAGAAVFGRATGSRELHTITTDHRVDRVDAVLLTGGSAYGLDAAAGVMRWMEERGRGYGVPGGVVPIVPAAVIFDLAPLGRFDARPTAEMAYAACDGATPHQIEEGSIGAGAGATVGKIAGPARAMKGGLGCAVQRNARWSVAALAVVNALGDVRAADGRIIAGARADDGFVDALQLLAGGDLSLSEAGRVPLGQGEPPNTTLCVVATDAPLSRTELRHLAQAAGAALFRRITPCGTVVDGDVVFALAPARAPTPADGAMLTVTMQVEALAILALENAIERAVRLARGRDGIPGLAD